MAIRRQWTAIEMLLMMALVAINGCIIGGSVLLTASGWAWTFIPLSLLPAVFQLLALCSAAAAAQKPMPADRTCANSVWWVVMLVIVGSGLAGVLGAASLTLYTACVCPDCIAGQPGVLFDSRSSACSSQQNTATLLLGCALCVQTLWGVLLLTYDISQRTCCMPAFPTYIPPTPSQAAAILAGTTAIPLATHYAVDIQAAELPPLKDAHKKMLPHKRRPPPFPRLAKSRTSDDGHHSTARQGLFRGETESIDSELIRSGTNPGSSSNFGTADSYGTTNFRVLARRVSDHVDEGGPTSPYMQRRGEGEEDGLYVGTLHHSYSGDLIMPPRLRAIEHPAEWDEEDDVAIPLPLQAARSYTPFACGPPGAEEEGGPRRV